MGGVNSRDAHSFTSRHPIVEGQTYDPAFASRRESSNAAVTRTPCNDSNCDVNFTDNDSTHTLQGGYLRLLRPTDMSWTAEEVERMHPTSVSAFEGRPRFASCPSASVAWSAESLFVSSVPRMYSAS